MIRLSNLTAQIESQKNNESNRISRRLPNRIFKLSNYSQKVFKLRFKSQSRLEFANHCGTYVTICHFQHCSHAADMHLVQNFREAQIVLYQNQSCFLLFQSAICERTAQIAWCNLWQV